MVPNIPAQAAWEALRATPRAWLCDVRTAPEWRHVGVPDLAALGRQTLCVSWQTAPAMQHNPEFLTGLRSAGVQYDDPVYFICRSGARSLAAAQAAQEAGYTHVFNVAEGFEGRADAAGWAALGLPSLLTAG